MKHFKQLFVLTLMLLVSICYVWGGDQTVTWTISGVKTTASGGTNVNTELTASAKSPNTETGVWTAVASTSYAGSSSGAQFGSSNYTFAGTITLSGTSIPSTATIKGITFNCTSTGTAYKVAASVANVSFGAQVTLEDNGNNVESAKDFSFSGSQVLGTGPIVLTFSDGGKKNVVIKSISVTYNNDGGGSNNPTLSIDPTSKEFEATGNSAQTIALTTNYFENDVTSVACTFYSESTCENSIDRPTWVNEPTVNDGKDEVSVNVADNNGAARETWMKITASDGSKSASAVFAISQKKYTEPTGTFVKYTGEITEGDYVIYYVSANTGYTLGNTAGSDRINNGESVTISNNKITNPDASIVWHIAPSGDYWTIYNEEVKRYVAGNHVANKGKLYVTVSDSSKWTVSGTSTYEFVNKLNITATAVNANLRNNGNNGWATYSTSTGGALTLYKKALPSHAVTFTAAPTGGEVALSVGGSAISSGNQVEEGATVTVTPTASSYYQIASVTKGGQEITPVNEVYSFVMPTTDVAVAATFELIPVTKVTLNKTELELVEGATETLSVTEVLPTTAQNTVEWSSTNTSVATVDQTGKVTAKTAGSATIKATSTVTTSVFGSCALTVNAPSGHAISITSANGTVTANQEVDVTDVASGTAVTLTAAPNDGYSISAWTVVGVDENDLTIAEDKTTCSFEMPNDEVLVEVTYTHETATLVLHDAEGEKTFDGENTHYWKESVTLPSTAAACSKTFMGWSANAECATAPEIAKGASYTIPNKGTNDLYAVYADVEETVSWNLATSVTAGDIIVISTNTDYTAQTMKTAGALSSDILGTTTSTYNNDKSQITTLAEGSLQLIVGGNSTDGWTLMSGTKYLAMKTNAKNKLQLQDDAYTWAISFNGNVATILRTGHSYTDNSTQKSGDFSIQYNYNNGSDRFSGYTSAMVAISLYKKTASAGAASNYSTTCTQQVEAPTILVAEEADEYLVAQEVTISAVEGATIYYTTNGDEPTTSSAVYSDPIQLNARGTYTIKAIAAMNGYDNSNVASKSFKINLPYTVAEALAETGTPTGIYVTGIISQLEDISTSYKNATYYISDNGTTTGQMYIYRGKYLNNADVAEANAGKFALGNKVTVKGNIGVANQANQLNQGNYLTELTEKELSSIVIGGTATKTTYSAQDNTFSFAGLTATGTYNNTGYVGDVTNEVTWKANNEASYTVAATGDVNVTATIGEVTSEAKVVAVTYTTKTVESIYLEYEETTVYVGAECPEPAVTAKYEEDIDDENVSDLASFDKSAYVANTAGTYTITVTYQGKESSYNVIVKAIANTKETAYTAVEVNDIIANAYKSTTASSYDVYVQGIVVADASNTSGKSVYYISADGTTTDQFYIYDAKYFDSSTSATGNVKKGDEIIVVGKILYYNSNTPELKSSTVVSQLREPEFAIADVVEMEVGQADLAVAPTTNSTGEITLESEGDNANIVTIVDGKLHAVAAGDAVVKAAIAETTTENALNYKAKERTFLVHVVAAKTRYTVSFNNGGATSGTDPEAIGDQLENAEVALPECTWTWANHGFTGWTVAETVSGDAVAVTDGHFTMPAAAVTITANWEEISTTHITFDVNGNTSVVEAVDVPQEVAYTAFPTNVDAVSDYTFIGWAEAKQVEDVEEAIATVSTYTPQAGEHNKTFYAVFKRTEIGANKTDVLTAADFPATSTGYVEFSDVQKVSRAKYAGKTANSNGNIQINKKAENGFYSSASGGVLVSVTVNMTSTDKAIGVYGSNTGFTGYTSIPSQTGVTAIETFSSKTSYTVTPAAEYKYVGIASSTDGAKQISSISFVWQPKATYYTTVPATVYDVTYDLGTDPAGAWKENEGCDDVKVKAGQTYTICTDVPEREHFNFVKWQVGGEDVSGEITISGNTTITAVWAAKAESVLKYNDGATEEPVEVSAGNKEEGTEITIPAVGTGEGQINFSKSGYDFKGWKYDGKIYKAGETFTMPAEAVTFVAQWKKQNLVKLTLVTSTAQLVAGSSVVFANQEAEAVAGASAAATNSFMIAETATFNSDKSLVTDLGDGIKMTLVETENGWAFKYNDKYLAPYSGNKMAWYETPTTWTITFDGNDAKIENGANYAMHYNKSSGQERFAAYGKTSCEAIQLYAEQTAINSGTTKVSEIGNVDDDVVVVSGENVVLEVDQPADSTSFVAQNGAKIRITAENPATKSVVVDEESKIEVTAPTTVNEVFSVSATMGGGKSGQLSGVDKVTLAQNVEAYFDITLGDNANPQHWHAIAVPFPVDALNGVYDAATGAKLTNEVNYAIMSYHGDERAQGLYGWKKFRGTLMPGVFYLMTVDGDTKTYRFKMSGTVLPTATSLALELYAASGDGQSTDAGWNGVANPTLQHGTVNQTVTVLNPETYTYEDKDAGEMNFVVGTPFFIQADQGIVDEGMSIGAVDGEKPYYAPKRVSENGIENIKVFFGNDAYQDKLTISASEEALNEYQIGKDLVKMTMTKTPKVAQIFGNAYNAKMCRIYAPLANNMAVYDLTLYAPNTGEYTIAAPEMENADIFLTKDGAIIWNLSMSACTLELNKGNNEGYGLILQAKAPNATTGCENIDASEAAQKVIIDNNVYILRNKQMYDVTGKAVK